MTDTVFLVSVFIIKQSDQLPGLITEIQTLNTAVTNKGPYSRTMFALNID